MSWILSDGTTVSAKRHIVERGEVAALIESEFEALRAGDRVYRTARPPPGMVAVETDGDVTAYLIEISQALGHQVETFPDGAEPPEDGITERDVEDDEVI